MTSRELELESALAELVASATRYREASEVLIAAQEKLIENLTEQVKALKEIRSLQEQLINKYEERRN